MSISELQAKKQRLRVYILRVSIHIKNNPLAWIYGLTKSEEDERMRNLLDKKTELEVQLKNL